MSRFAALLKTSRTRHGLTLRQVAAQASLSIGYLSDVERGRTVPTLGAMDQLLAIYGLRLEVTDGDPVDEAYERGYAAALRDVRETLAGMAGARGGGRSEEG